VLRVFLMRKAKTQAERKAQTEAEEPKGMYDQIVEALGKTASEDEMKLNRDQVIYAYREGIKNLQKRLSPPAA